MPNLTIPGLLEQMERDGSLRAIATNPLVQFGRGPRQYLGATILPERQVPENAYRDFAVRFRTIIANNSTRYSPPQMKRGAITGSVLVELAESDAASELTAQEYDTLRRVLRQGGSMEAVATAVNFLDTTVNVPLVERNELMRWQGLVDAVIKLRGDGGFAEDVAVENPAGHRYNVPAAWSLDTTDPIADILNGVQVLVDKGYAREGMRLVTSSRVLSIMSKNAMVRARTSRIIIQPNAAITTARGRAGLSEINGILNAEGLPNMELYDLTYNTQTGTGRFMANDVFVILAPTGRDETIDLAGIGAVEPVIVPNTLGYVGVGVPAGQDNPGRVLIQKFRDTKPPSVEAQGWQTSLPVVLDPEAIVVLKSIS